MPPFYECCVLIPSGTLEDFPADATDYDARSLLAAWTVLWHPRLLAFGESLPTWYRADTPPESPGNRIFTVPTPSLPLIPQGYEPRCRETEGCRWITGASRDEMLSALAAGGGEPAWAEQPPLPVGRRRIDCDDFFAFGYAMLQVNVMTRRLRYTSNLDELRVQSRIVAAAKAYLARDAEATAEALHDAFDALAEERDHYFASDPSLIDLTLLVPSMVRGWAEGLAAADGHVATDGETDSDDSNSAEAGPDDAAKGGDASADASGREAGRAGDALAIPGNVVIDAETAVALAGLPGDTGRLARERLASGAIGWAGGGPPADVCFDALTVNEAERQLVAAHGGTVDAVGIPPTVYARFSGSTPPDLTATLVGLGYRGMIPVDFAHGSGFGDEAKVICQSDGAEIEALTAKPIDAAGDAGFLALASRLGEAIDSGEIATALLAHWPGRDCDSFRDLRRAASWGLALGRFWTLHDYFVEGESPFHHGAASAASAEAAERLAEQVERGARDPIAKAAREFVDTVRSEQAAIVRGMAALVRGGAGAAEAGEATSRDASSGGGEDPERSERVGGSGSAEFAAACGATPVEPTAAASPGSSGAASGKPPGESGGGATPPAAMLVNAGSVGWRQTVRIAGPGPSVGGWAYACTDHGGSASVTVDVPAHGFTLVTPGAGKPKGPGLLARLRGPKPLADETLLQNEFMEVMIDPETGGIQGGFSGNVRGNRLSVRLVHVAGTITEEPESTMKLESRKLLAADADVGRVEVRGGLISSAGDRRADYRLVYTLRRGSRLLEVGGRITPRGDLGGDPWKHYIAARTAVASEATSYRLLLRDKLHRPRGRRLVAPLGVLVDEGERRTLVASHGRGYHRRVGDRFLDTLLAVRGESDPEFKLHYGFDVKAAVATARTLVATPDPIAVAASELPSPQGWIVHNSPSRLLVTKLEVQRRGDGQLSARVRVVETRGDGCTAEVYFCRNVSAAWRLTGDPRRSDVGDGDPDARKLECDGDRVRWSAGGHSVSDIRVVFAAG